MVVGTVPKKKKKSSRLLGTYTFPTDTFPSFILWRLTNDDRLDGNRLPKIAVLFGLVVSSIFPLMICSITLMLLHGTRGMNMVLVYYTSSSPDYHDILLPVQRASCYGCSPAETQNRSTVRAPSDPLNRFCISLRKCLLLYYTVQYYPGH